VHVRQKIAALIFKLDPHAYQTFIISGAQVRELLRCSFACAMIYRSSAKAHRVEQAFMPAAKLLAQSASAAEVTLGAL
jgi:hypothetical protein